MIKGRVAAMKTETIYSTVTSLYKHNLYKSCFTLEYIIKNTIENIAPIPPYEPFPILWTFEFTTIYTLEKFGNENGKKYLDFFIADL